MQKKKFIVKQQFLLSKCKNIKTILQIQLNWNLLDAAFTW